MDKAIKIFNIFSDKTVIRIYKMLTKKMLTPRQIADIMESDIEIVNMHIESLVQAEIIKLLPGPEKTYFAKSQSAIFDKYAKSVTELINKWFNQDECIINDFYRMNKLKGK